MGDWNVGCRCMVRGTGCEVLGIVKDWEEEMGVILISIILPFFWDSSDILYFAKTGNLLKALATKCFILIIVTRFFITTSQNCPI